ncbi:DNA translocase FtsK [Desulfitobacterium sp.]|uniref:DNA translocase FtsK n=1 Tax=Desulfitobacterium sp. TaxID=49981 RepID=UPI002B2016EB|nr:DNA translocase FtsK [Desulfitobacterium sp.]MEA4902789.1 DNA translocase FtsK [Desulfitobacterium sp.]
MPKRQKNSQEKWRVAAILSGVIGFIGILGEFELTGIGRALYTGLKSVFGNIAWGIPLCLLLVTIIIEVRLIKGQSLHKTNHQRSKKSRSVSEQRTKRSVSLQEEKKGIPLPKGKLVSLQGFQEYFASDEGPKIESAAAEEPLPELGRDFNTYFQEGAELSLHPFKTQFTVEPLNGFPSYFEQVLSDYELEKSATLPDEDISAVPEKSNWLGLLKNDSEKVIPGQVAQLAQLAKVQTPKDAINEKENLDKGKQDLDLSPLKTDQEESKVDDLYKAEPLNSIVEKAESPLKLENIENPADKPIDIIPDQTADIPEDITPETPEEEDSNECVAPSQPGRQKSWLLPKFETLDALPDIPVVHDTETQKKLEQVLADFGVQAKVIRVTRGPVITRYELAPAPGVKISRIVNLADDIALGLAARDVRIEAPIPGKAAIGIEVPNKQPRPVPFREVLETAAFNENPSKLKTALGKNISNQPVIADLAKMPHILIAGATGSGKSVCITTIINSILFNAQPNEVKFLMVDPKMVELSIYNGIPHLIAPVVTDPKKAAAALKWIVKEMETRYELFAAAGVKDIGRYNRQKAESEQATPALPWIVVIIDELADLMMVAANDVEEAICRLAQMARAAGIHLVIATQRPSVDVITGVIKANIPSRISFAVSSQIDSRTILDATGAEKLLGRGDMLYSPQGINKPVRVQGCFVSDDEVQRIIDYWKSQGKPEYLAPEGFMVETESKTESSGPDDELFVDAGRMIMDTGMASVSFLQRKFKLGYARAARLMDLLEDNGVVGGYEGSKPRQILMTKEEFEERYG